MWKFLCFLLCSSDQIYKSPQGELGTWPFGLLGLGGVGLGTEAPKGLGVLWEMVGGASYSIFPGPAPACYFLSL